MWLVHKEVLYQLYSTLAFASTFRRVSAKLSEFRRAASDYYLLPRNMETSSTRGDDVLHQQQLQLQQP